MSWDAGNPRDGRNPFSGNDTPAGYRAALNAQLTGNLRPQPLVGGITEQIHTETGDHSVTLSGTEPSGKPLLFRSAHNLFRETERTLWLKYSMTIGERIRAARLALGFTQRHVARELAVNPSAVNQWESGATKPSIAKRVELAALLSLRIDELIPEAPIDEITDTIARIVRSLPPQKRVALLAAVEGLAKLIGDPPPNNPASPEAKVKQNS